MKFLFDFFPILLFFGVYALGEHYPQTANALAVEYLVGLVAGATIKATLAPVLLATAVAIAATIVQISYMLMRRKKIDALLWVSFAIISVMGGLTIYFQNDTFIKWKPTLVYWCFASAFLGTQIFSKKNLIRTMMEKQIPLPDHVWPQLNLAWTVFFALMGVLNLYVAFSFSLSTWVTFKAFGATGLMFVFIIGQTLFLSKYMKEPE